MCGTVDRGVSWVASLPVGSGLLADRYLRSDPPEPGELAALREHVEGVFADLDAPKPGCAYAVGGSATSLHRHVTGGQSTQEPHITGQEGERGVLRGGHGRIVPGSRA